VPFPRPRFFLCSFASLTADSTYTRLNVKEWTAQAVSARNFYCNVQPDDGKVLALSFVFRGKAVESKEVDQVMQTLHQDEAMRATQFVDWIPNNIKSGIYKLAGAETMSVTNSVLGSAISRRNQVTGGKCAELLDHMLSFERTCEKLDLRG